MVWNPGCSRPSFGAFHYTCPATPTEHSASSSFPHFTLLEAPWHVWLLQSQVFLSACPGDDKLRQKEQGDRLKRKQWQQKHCCLFLWDFLSRPHRKIQHSDSGTHKFVCKGQEPFKAVENLDSTCSICLQRFISCGCNASSLNLILGRRCRKNSN